MEKNHKFDDPRPALERLLTALGILQLEILARSFPDDERAIFTHGYHFPNLALEEAERLLISLVGELETLKTMREAVK